MIRPSHAWDLYCDERAAGVGGGRKDQAAAYTTTFATWAGQWDFLFWRLGECCLFMFSVLLLAIIPIPFLLLCFAANQKSPIEASAFITDGRLGLAFDGYLRPVDG